MITMTVEGVPFIVDPNSTTGLLFEGWTAFVNKFERASNPYVKSHPGSLAEIHWFEGWDGAQKSNNEQI